MTLGGYRSEVVDKGRTNEVQSPELRSYGIEDYPVTKKLKRRMRLPGQSEYYFGEEREEVFGFLSALKNEVQEIILKREFDYVKRVWAVALEHRGGEEQKSRGAMLIALGVVESGDPHFPYTPVMWMLPMETEDSIDAWSGSQEERVRNMKKLLKTRLISNEETRVGKRGGKGKLAVGIHGWGGVPVVWSKFMQHFLSGLENKSELQSCVLLSLGTQGALVTDKETPSEKSLEQVVMQVEGTLSHLADDLGKSTGEDTIPLPVNGMRENFWRRIALVFGHSMGGWVALRLANSPFWQNIERKYNDRTKFLVMNHVVHGVEVSEQDQGLLKAWFGIEQTEGDILLLETVLGLVTRLSPQLMQVGALRNVADKTQLVSFVVRTFMGRLRGWEKILHEWSVLNDQKQIAANNSMLIHAPTAIDLSGSTEVVKDRIGRVKDLVATGRMYFVAGLKDKILYAKSIIKMIEALGADIKTDTVEHYPMAEFGQQFSELMGAFESPIVNKGSLD